MTAAAPASLAEALARLQGQLPRVAKEHTAKVETKTGGNYKYAYADLTDVSSALLPVMAALGLSFIATPTLADGRFVLAYELAHVSGQQYSGQYPLPDPDRLGPQDLGKAITYARRYALCAVTGLAPGGDDDDGREAQQEYQARPAGALRRPVDARTKERAKTTRTHAARSADGTPVDVSTGEVLAPGDLTDPEDKPGSILPGHLRTIWKQLDMLGYHRDDKDGMHAEMESRLNLRELPPHPEKGVPSAAGLSMVQGTVIIRSLQDSLDAKHRNEEVAGG